MGKFKEYLIDPDAVREEVWTPEEPDFTEMQRVEALGLVADLGDEIEEKTYKYKYYQEAITEIDLEDWLKQLKKISAILF